MPRGRPARNPDDVLIRSAELIGWALGGIEREIAETKTRLAALTAQANQLRARIGRKPGRPSAPPQAPPPHSANDVAGNSEASAGRKRRRKRNLSPEARKALSDRMTKMWA